MQMMKTNTAKIMNDVNVFINIADQASPVNLQNQNGPIKNRSDSLLVNF